MGHRDDFKESVKRAVAGRAGWLCSLCRKLTLGPSEEGPDRTTSIGKAAHIAAAAPGPGARRYDASMTPVERAGIGNAIWLCADHADLVDRDEVAYSVAKLHAIRREHELFVARAVRTGAGANLTIGLVAIGPNIVCTGDLSEIAADSWSLSLAHFLIGDIHTLVSFISDFAEANPQSQYLLSNELGDGRVLSAAPNLKKVADGYELFCPVMPAAPRIDAHKLGSDLALHPDTGDLYLDEKGSIARVSGVDYLPQKVASLLSMNQGESVFSPTFGMRFFEYFEAFRGSPWLDLLLKLDVVRQASVPLADRLAGRRHTPLKCVKRVLAFELLIDQPTDNRLRARIALDVQGVGNWERELSIYIPTAEQMAERARLRKEMPWLADTLSASAEN